MMIWQRNLKRIYVFTDFEKIVKSKCQEGDINDFTEFVCQEEVGLEKYLQNLQINLEAKRMDGSSWKKKLYCVSFYSILCRLSPFHREWPQLATILTSSDFPPGKKSKSLTFDMKQAIHGEKNLTCKE